MGLFSFWTHFNNAQEEGFEPDRARSVKRTRQWRVLSAVRSVQADRINFEQSSKFGHPSSSTHILATFNPNPISQTCTPSSKNDIFRHLWSVMYTFAYDAHRA